MRYVREYSTRLACAIRGVRDAVRVVNPEVGRTPRGSRARRGHQSQVNLHAVTGCVAVPAAGVLAGGKSEALIVRKGSTDIPDPEDRGDRLQRHQE